MDKRFHCQHCDQKISKTLYYQHKKLYYKPDSNEWTKSDQSAGDTLDHQSTGSTYTLHKDFLFSDEEEASSLAGSICVDQSFDFGTSPDPVNMHNDESDSEKESNFVMDDETVTEVWLDSPLSEDDEISVNDQQVSSSTLQAVRFYIMFLLLWQSWFRVSDSGVNLLLLFIATFFSMVCTVFKCKELNNMISLLPMTLSAAKKLIGRGVDEFTKYVSCPNCHSLYAFDVCKVTLPNKTVVSRNCSYVQFPNHPHQIQRAQCNTLLMKTVRTSAGTISLYPRQVYCYQSVVQCLHNFFLRPGFVEKTEQWRFRQNWPNVLSDVYDGKVWNEYLVVEGHSFLELPYNLALSLNVDWFQPFKHSTYSIGAIYLSIMNLPRCDRYTSENIIFAGIIPGPKEPHQNANTYLRPLVNELIDLWKGVPMRLASGLHTIVRAVLLCVSCDIPACRKVCGFVGHNAYRACSRCLKGFPTKAFGEKPDFTGIDRDLWTKRSIHSHRANANKHKLANTKKMQKEIEREHGLRYSVLLELPYFDVIRYSVIDPMHNLLLGTSKHMLSTWMSLGLLDKTNLSAIQNKVDSFITPSDVGRIPSKISSNFAGFTAEQWRNWTLIYSCFSLKDILPYKHYDCWLLFVKAVSFLCKRCVTIDEISRGDEILIDFCQVFQELYGSNHYTINLHLHSHLKECLLDFGPVYSFWLFAFERLNGILGSYQTNCHDISIQLMRRFLTSQNVGHHSWPDEYKSVFFSLLKKKEYQAGSLKPSSFNEAIDICTVEDILPLPPLVELAWIENEKEQIHNLLLTVIGHDRYDLLTLYNRAFALNVGGYILGSALSRHTTKTHVMVAQSNDSSRMSLATIQYFCKLNYTLHVPSINNQSKTSTISKWIAFVNFYDEHPCRVWYGGRTEVWCCTHSDSKFINLSNVAMRSSCIL